MTTGAGQGLTMLPCQGQGLRQGLTMLPCQGQGLRQGLTVLPCQGQGLVRDSPCSPARDRGCARDGRSTSEDMRYMWSMEAVQQILRRPPPSGPPKCHGLRGGGDWRLCID